MSAISVRLPNSIHKHLQRISKKEGVSINQLIATAVAEKISALETADYLGRAPLEAHGKLFLLPWMPRQTWNRPVSKTGFKKKHQPAN